MLANIYSKYVRQGTTKCAILLGTAEFYSKILNIFCAETRYEIMKLILMGVKGALVDF